MMEKINFSKHQSMQNKANELTKIKQKIVSITGYEPDSIKLNNDTLTIKCRNKYEALEMRYKSEALADSLGLQIKVY